MHFNKLFFNQVLKIYFYNVGKEYFKEKKMNEQKPTRTNLLSALCLLTFIGSTLSFFGYFLASLFFDKASDLIIKYSNWYSVDAISPLYFTIFMALSAISLVGAIRMWKLHRDGFFIYMAAQIFILFLPVVWIGWHSLAATQVIFSAIFIGGYALSSKNLN